MKTATSSVLAALITVTALTACGSSADSGDATATTSASGSGDASSAASTSPESPSATESTPSVTPNSPLAEVLVEVEVGGSTLGIVADPAAPRVWVGSWDSVVGINTDTNSVESRIKGFRLASGIGLLPGGTQAIVTDYSANAVMLVDLSTEAITSKVKVGDSPEDPLISEDGTLAYVPIGGDREIIVLNTSTLEEVDRWKLKGEPSAITNGFNAGTILAALEDRDTVAEIDIATGQVLQEIGVQREPSALAVSPQGDVLYVVNRASETVSVIDTSTLGTTRTIQVGDAPSSVTFTPDGTYAYVTNYKDGTIDVIDVAASDVIDSIFTGYQTAYFALSPDGSSGYATGGPVIVLAPTS